MCLTNIKTKFIDDDVICYKVMWLKNKQMYSSVLMHPYELGEVMLPDRDVKLEPGDKVFEIGLGFMHSYKYKFQAWLNYVGQTYDPDYTACLVKCRIPKDCGFIWEGRVNYDIFRRGYASKKIIVEKIIKCQIPEKVKKYMEWHEKKNRSPKKKHK